MVILGTYFEEQGATWNTDAFLKMRNLKLLKIDYIGHVPTHLPYNLRILDWTNYPLKSLQSSFQLGELRQLCLRQSKIEQLWIGLKVSVLLNILMQLCFISQQWALEN